MKGFIKNLAGCTIFGLLALVSPRTASAQEGMGPAFDVPPAVIQQMQPPNGATLEGGSFAPLAPGVEPGLDTLGPTLPDDAVIQYDPDTDSIIVITDEATNANIGRVIESLDQPVSQVLIKVLFLEVTYSDNVDIGVQAAITYGGRIDSDTGELENEDTLGTNFGLATELRGGIYRIISDDFTATIRALERVGKLEVLSRPSVLARNNETATITIGQEVPFIRNSRITDEGQTINTVEYEDIGIILQVTPHVTAENLVEMEVSPEISTLTGETVAISETVNARVIAKRSAETNVVVPDGKTVVIGGLMEDNNTTSVERIPVLGTLPVLGALFRRTITNKVKTELIIFLTPYVVRTPTELQTLSVSESNRGVLPARAFTGHQQDKFLDELGTGGKRWMKNDPKMPDKPLEEIK